MGKNGTSESLLQFGSKRTKTISASLLFENKKFTDIYDFSLVKAVNDTLIFAEESITSGREKYELSSGQKESFLLTDAATHVSERVVRTILSRCKTFQFHDTSSEAHIRNTANIDNNRFLMSDGGNAAAYLYMLKKKHEKYYNRIVEHVRYVMPTFHDFYLEPQILNPQWIKLQWLEKGNSEYVFGPEHFSDGTLRFIALATLFLQPPELLPQVIFVDEPELGLHPQAVDVLASMVQKAVKHTQVIMATQSPRLLDNFDSSNIIVAEKDEETCCTSLKRLDENEIEIWLEDYSLSQIWEKNIIGGQP
ncbi:MAG: AAA family ATPase [Roseburia sp.]|nr:AAA family ATPase [Roseburia sp.]